MDRKRFFFFFSLIHNYPWGKLGIFITLLLLAWVVFNLRFLPSVSLCSEQCWGGRAGAAVWAKCSHVSHCAICSVLLTAGTPGLGTPGFAMAGAPQSHPHWLHTVKDTLLVMGLVLPLQCNLFRFRSDFWICFEAPNSPPCLLHSICIFLLLPRENTSLLIEKFSYGNNSCVFLFPIYCVLESKIRNSVTCPLMWFAVCLPIWGFTLPLWQSTLVNVMCSSG